MEPKRDARKLGAWSQAILRQKVVAAVQERGLSRRDAATEFGVSRAAVYKWMRAVAQEGVSGLEARKRGPKPYCTVPQAELDAVFRLMASSCPDGLNLPFAVWTREAVRRLIRRQCKVDLSVWTVSRYLSKWGLDPGRLRDRAHGTRWWRWQYPGVQKAARANGEEVLWVEERWVGLRVTDGPTELMLFSAVSNRGQCFLMLCSQKLTPPVFVEFLGRVLRQAKRKVVLLVDDHPVHRSSVVGLWVTRHAEQLRLIRLPWHSRRIKVSSMARADRKKQQRIRKQQRRWRQRGGGYAD